ncbi:hypothetical protein AAVH_29604 [Aphelenchoides avenae]|nr:hypothetical protein AAVH_29604 [Aphelenchus avenae]
MRKSPMMLMSVSNDQRVHRYKPHAEFRHWIRRTEEFEKMGDAFLLRRDKENGNKLFNRIERHAARGYLTDLAPMKDFDVFELDDCQWKGIWEKNKKQRKQLKTAEYDAKYGDVWDEWNGPLDMRGIGPDEWISFVHDTYDYDYNYDYEYNLVQDADDYDCHNDGNYEDSGYSGYESDYEDSYGYSYCESDDGEDFSTIYEDDDDSC